MNQKLVTLTKQSNAEQMTALTAAIEEQKSSTEKRFQQLDRKLDGQEQETRQLDAGLQGVRQQMQKRDSAMSDSQRSTDVGDSSSVQKRPQRSSTLGSRKRRDDDVVLQGGGPNSTYVVHAGHELVGKDIEIYWDGDEEWFACTVEAYDPTADRPFSVQYHDGTTSKEDLSEPDFVRVAQKSGRGRSSRSKASRSAKKRKPSAKARSSQPKPKSTRSRRKASSDAVPATPKVEVQQEPDSLFDEMVVPSPAATPGSRAGAGKPVSLADAETQMEVDACAEEPPAASPDLLADSPQAAPRLHGRAAAAVPPRGGRVQAPLRPQTKGNDTSVFEFTTQEPDVEAAVKAHLKSTKDQIRQAQQQRRVQAATR